MNRNTRKTNRVQGFTLLEIVIVLAVTAVVFGLLLRPVISSLSLTQEAQTLSAAQDQARKATTQLTRELGHANYVLDGMSNPFAFSTAPTAPAGSYDTYSDFLNLQVPTAGNGRQIAHVYGAKLDFFLPRPSAIHAFTDPTTGEPIYLNSSSGGSTIAGNPVSVFPLAPNINLVRYFVALQHPGTGTSPTDYVNANAGFPEGAEGNNTYVLYRAQVPVTDSSGNLNTNYWPGTKSNPGFDDPDFFRYVASTDVNWLDSGHAPYGAASVTHNKMVDAWVAAAVPVLTGPNVDLLDIPRDADGTFDSGLYNQVTDLVPGTPVNYLVATVSVSFTPKSFSAEGLTATQTSDAADGLTSTPSTVGTVFIPTTYTAADKMWSSNAVIYLNPGAAGNQYVVQQTFVGNPVGTAPTSPPSADNTGDLVETLDGVKVYNVTQGFAETGAKGNYIPFTLNRDTGLIDFATTPENLTGADTNFTFATGGATAFSIATADSNGLGTEIDPVSGVANAHIVPGSVKVIAGDGDAGIGATAGNFVPYQFTIANPPPNTATNEFTVNYDSGGAVVPTPPSITTTTLPANQTVLVRYQYQANMSLGTTAYVPYSVSASFQGRNAITVNMGVRIYRPSSALSDLVTLPTTIAVGNANH